MRVNAFGKVIGDASIQRAVTLTGENVDEAMRHASMMEGWMAGLSPAMVRKRSYAHRPSLSA